MTVYIDILFLINFFADFILLSMTARLATVRIRLRRKLLSAMVGGFGGVFHFIFASSPVHSLFMSILTPPLLIFLSLFLCNKRIFFRCLFVYYLSAFLLSGAASLVAGFMGIYGIGITSPIIYLVGAILLGILKNTVGFLKSEATKGSQKITVSYGGKSFVGEAILDTGNSLYDPISKKPVIVADKLLLEELFAPGCNQQNITEWLNPTDLRMIPYKTIDKSGVMVGFLPESVSVASHGPVDAIIAISPEENGGKVLLGSAII